MGDEERLEYFLGKGDGYVNAKSKNAQEKMDSYTRRYEEIKKRNEIKNVLMCEGEMNETERNMSTGLA